jgi:hypothetical protein
MESAIHFRPRRGTPACRPDAAEPSHSRRSRRPDPPDPSTRFRRPAAPRPRPAPCLAHDRLLGRLPPPTLQPGPCAGPGPVPISAGCPNAGCPNTVPLPRAGRVVRPVSNSRSRRCNAVQPPADGRTDGRTAGRLAEGCLRTSCCSARGRGGALFRPGVRRRSAGGCANLDRVTADGGAGGSERRRPFPVRRREA